MEYQAWCGKTTSIAPLSPLATEANPGLAEGCEGWRSFSSHSIALPSEAFFDHRSFSEGDSERGSTIVIQ
jgi:hypothetical protein